MWRCSICLASEPFSQRATARGGSLGGPALYFISPILLPEAEITQPNEGTRTIYYYPF